MIEIPTAIVAAFVALGGLLITIGGIVVRQAVAMTQNQAGAKAAQAIAGEAKAEAALAMNRAEAMARELALFREQVAREYASRDTIREFRNELMEAIRALGTRFDKYVDREK